MAEIRRTAAEVEAMQERALAVEDGGDDRVQAFMDGVYDTCDWLFGAEPSLSMPTAQDDDG